MNQASSQTRILSRRSLLAGAGLTIFARHSDARAAEKVRFTVTELPADLEGLTGTFGRGINRSATVVGIATGELGPAAVRSRGKTAWNLPSSDLASIANAINDAGVIVGSVDIRAAVWVDDELRQLPSLGDDRSTAYAINADGIIVGSVDRGANSGVAVRWDGDEITELASLGGPSSRATGVNADGVIVGFSTRDDSGELVRAVRWLDDEIEGIGTLGGEISQANGINRHGHIVGSSTSREGLSAVDHAFRYVDGKMSRLERLGRVRIRGQSGSFKLDRSSALAINDEGDICGFSSSASENGAHSVATLWIGDDVIDLNSAIGKANREIVLSSADGINRHRDLVCTGHLVDEQDVSRLFRLEPA